MAVLSLVFLLYHVSFYLHKASLQSQHLHQFTIKTEFKQQQLTVSSKDFSSSLFWVLIQIGAPPEAPSPMLSRDIMHEKMPWNSCNILLLRGEGFALAHGSEVGAMRGYPFHECLDADVYFPTLDKEIWTLAISTHTATTTLSTSTGLHGETMRH